MERVKMIFTCDRCGEQYRSQDFSVPDGWKKVEITEGMIVDTYFLCPDCAYTIVEKIRGDDRDD